MHPISTREKCLYFWKNRSGFARLFPEAFAPEVPWVLTKGKRMGFDAPIAQQKKDLVNIFRQVTPQDLVKFGLVPELVGRLPKLIE